MTKPKITINLLAFAVAFTLGASAAPAQTESIDLGHGVKMEFVLIPAGSFTMGSPEEVGDGDETPPHSVTLSQPFYFGKFEVTQAQWAQVMNTNPSRFQGANFPVDTVSWNDCQRFLENLRAKTGRDFSLPTEAQWEYACRAGTTTPWNFGEQNSTLGDYAWFEANANGTTHAVGEKKPNSWGVHDLYGNIGEWCADWYERHYPGTAVIDPTGPATGDSRVVRGGAWGDNPMGARSAYRNANGPDGANHGIGFRCVVPFKLSPSAK